MVRRIIKANSSFGVMGALMLSIDFDNMILSDLVKLKSMLNFEYKCLNQAIKNKGGL